LQLSSWKLHRFSGIKCCHDCSLRKKWLGGTAQNSVSESSDKQDGQLQNAEELTMCIGPRGITRTKPSASATDPELRTRKVAVKIKQRGYISWQHGQILRKQTLRMLPRAKEKEDATSMNKKQPVGEQVGKVVDKGAYISARHSRTWAKESIQRQQDGCIRLEQRSRAQSLEDNRGAVQVQSIKETIGSA